MRHNDRSNVDVFAKIETWSVSPHVMGFWLFSITFWCTLFALCMIPFVRGKGKKRWRNLYWSSADMFHTTSLSPFLTESFFLFRIRKHFDRCPHVLTIASSSNGSSSQTVVPLREPPNGIALCSSSLKNIDVYRISILLIFRISYKIWILVGYCCSHILTYISWAFPNTHTDYIRCGSRLKMISQMNFFSRYSIESGKNYPPSSRVTSRPWAPSGKWWAAWRRWTRLFEDGMNQRLTNSIREHICEANCIASSSEDVVDSGSTCVPS